VYEFPYHNSRPIRPGEIPGQNYRFSSVAEIEELCAASREDVLTAEVYRDLHAVDLRDLKRAIEDPIYLLTIIQCARPMARQLKARLPRSRTIFLFPVTHEQLRAIAEHDTRATCHALDVLRKRRQNRPSAPAPEDQLMCDIEAVFQMLDADWYDEIVFNPDGVSLDEVQQEFLKAALTGGARFDTSLIGVNDHADTE